MNEETTAVDQNCGPERGIPAGESPSESSMPAPTAEPSSVTEQKPAGKTPDVVDGLLMIIFAFALYAEIHSVFLYGWH